MKKLVRINAERKIAGICTGLGAYFDMDPLIFRLAFIVSMFCGGIGLLVYLVMWIMVPLVEGEAGSTGKPSRLHLSSTDKKLAGVCGGLGEFFKLDAVIFRVGFVVAALVGGAGVFVYVVLWLLVPRAEATTATVA